MKWARVRLVYIISFTVFATAGLIIHGLYHLSQEGYIPQGIYVFLIPALGPSDTGRVIHVVLEAAAIFALAMAIQEYAVRLFRMIKGPKAEKTFDLYGSEEEMYGSEEESDW